MRTVVCMLLILGAASWSGWAAAQQVGGRSAIDAFNEALSNATRRMDNAATVALWEEDGISLLPDVAPIVGRQAIAKFMDRVTGRLPGAHMQTFELHCFNIEVAGDWASEWCMEHQLVQFANGNTPFEGWGNMLLVLHRGRDSVWRLRREMWNQARAVAATRSTK